MNFAGSTTRLLLAAALGLLTAGAGAVELVLERTTASPAPTVAVPLAGQLPHSTRADGTGTVALAWLAGATPRYAHGVLGDRLEASRLTARLSDGRELRLELPEQRVFEDLVPRLVDLDADGIDEVVVVESDAREGAALAVVGVVDGELAVKARSPFIGRANRWLNPVGVADFDGDGRLDLALIRTPHIGGVLEVYRYAEPGLERVAARRGYSTHVIGSTELGLGQVVAGADRARLLLPNQRRDRLVLVELRERAIVELTDVSLPAPLSSSLRRVATNTFEMQLDDGQHYLLTVGG